MYIIEQSNNVLLVLFNGLFFMLSLVDRMNNESPERENDKQNSKDNGPTNLDHHWCMLMEFILGKFQTDQSLCHDIKDK